MNSGLLLLLICGLLTIVALVLFLPTRASRTKANIRADRHPTGAVFRDDDRYWSAGFLYNNPDDPDPFVPQRFGFGYTPNVGHPVGKLFLIGVLLVPLVVSLLGVLFPGLITSYGCHPSGCHPFP